MSNKIHLHEVRNSIIELLHSTKRQGVTSVIEYMENNGFFTVPSSKNRHHNWEGGLAEHCLGVCKIALRLAPELPPDSIILCGLLHDICKASKLYKGTDGLFHHRDVHIKGHGYRSIKLLQLCGLRLSEEERLTIRWHMGGHHAVGREYDEIKMIRTSRLWQVITKADKLDASGKEEFG